MFNIPRRRGSTSVINKVSIGDGLKAD